MFGYLWVELRFGLGQSTRTWRWKSDRNQNRTVTWPTNIRTWPQYIGWPQILRRFRICTQIWPSYPQSRVTSPNRCRGSSLSNRNSDPIRPNRTHIRIHRKILTQETKNLYPEYSSASKRNPMVSLTFFRGRRWRIWLFFSLSLQIVLKLFVKRSTKRMLTAYDCFLAVFWP